ncbi:sel1 repeat family protein [Methylomonas sp. SURF-2]|uniref:Sel1 repeat family protein n=1 Tax=Methylomonas subterranea TaxID=2952225 RepID=A0ABT1TFT0_9GAMM|nr:tetratricopeptide repeat protein [Methylomonas sp. SURF-2]MCQ8104321.1 sel1 repeat family protein [Methylomonas sp. SURF-2]
MNTNGNKSLAEIEARESQILAELEQRAAAGDAQAQFELAARYLVEPNLDVHIGRVVHKNDPLDFPNSKQTSSRSDFDVCFQKSLKQLETSANQGLAEAQFTLGLLYFQGPSTMERTRKLQTAWSDHLNFDFPLSGEIAVSLANFSKYQLSDNNAAFSWFEKAAKQNYYEALIWLGICHRDGTQANNEKAFACFASAAKQGLAEAQWLVAECYFKGQGVEQNETLAYDWLENAADNGYPDDRYYSLACEYLDGNPETRNLEEGIKWLKKAAPFNIFAKMRLVNHSLNGIGVEKNDELAFDLVLDILEEDENSGCCSNFILGTNFKWNDLKMGSVQQRAKQELIGQAAYLAARMIYEGNGSEVSYKWIIEGLFGRGIAKNSMTSDLKKESTVLLFKFAVSCNNPQALQLMQETYLHLITPELNGKNDLEDYYQFAYEWLSDAYTKAPRDAEVNFGLGVLYAFGKGVEKDKNRARELLGKFEKFKEELDGPEFSYLDDYTILQQFSDFYCAPYRQLNRTIGNLATAFFEKNFINEGYGWTIPYMMLPALRIKFYIKKGDLDGLRIFLEDLDSTQTVFSESGSYQQFKDLALMAYKKEEKLSEINKVLVAEIKQKEVLQMKMQKLVEQFTHTLGNVIFPDTIYQVAERLKTNPDCRKDVLLLNEAYHSEIIIKLQAELLRQRYANTNPEKFRQLIRACRRGSDCKDKTKSIADILDYAASRVTARFLNQHNASLGSIRDKIIAQKNASLDGLRQQFEDDILLNRTLAAVEWINQNLRPFKVVELSPLWLKAFILAESHAEALLFGYFSEVLFNAFKYADHDAAQFLTVRFDEYVIDGETYLGCSWSNPMGNKPPNGLGTGKGLDAILEDLKQLNDTDSETKSLLVSQDDLQFQVTMFFQKDLLIDEISMPTFKRKSKTE